MYTRNIQHSHIVSRINLYGMVTSKYVIQYNDE